MADAIKIGGLPSDYYERYISVKVGPTDGYKIVARLAKIVDRIIFLFAKIFSEFSFYEFLSDQYLLKKFNQHDFENDTANRELIEKIAQMFTDREYKTNFDPKPEESAASNPAQPTQEGPSIPQEEPAPPAIPVETNPVAEPLSGGGSSSDDDDSSLPGDSPLSAGSPRSALSDNSSESSSSADSTPEREAESQYDPYSFGTDSVVLVSAGTEQSSSSSSSSYYDKAVNAAGAAASYMAKTVDAVASLSTAYLWQSQDPEYIKWKVRRFEAQLMGMQAQFKALFREHDLRAIVQNYNEKTAPVWQQRLIPLIKLFVDDFIPAKDEEISDLYLNAIRKQYNKDFLGNLRVAARWANQIPSDQAVSADEKQAVKYIHHLCLLMYGSLEFNNEHRDVLHTMSSSSQAPQQNLISGLQDIYNDIKTAPDQLKIAKTHSWFSSLIGYFNVGFDPNAQSNPTHVLYEKNVRIVGQDPRVIKDFAMGSPTKEIGGKAEINPEFHGAMRHYQENSKVHLYVNNQNYIPSSVGGCEVNRCNAIHQFAEETDGLYAITLSQNSPFYKEGYTDPKYSVPSKFCEKLIFEMFDGEPSVTGNYIPQSVKNEFEARTGQELKDWSVGMAEKIRRIAFGREWTLDEKSRSIFIRLFYRHLVQKLLIVLNADSYNESCKDRIDRGAASDAEEFARLAILNDLEAHPKVIKFFKMMVFARAIVVRKRAIIEERLHKLIDVVEFMLEKKQAVKDMHAAIFGEEVKMSFDPNALIS